MKTLYLVNSAQTIFDKAHRLQGWSDSPLTEVGKKQAKHLGDYFKERGILFDHAYSSTSERASDTLELIIDMPYTRYRELKARGMGRHEGEEITYKYVSNLGYYLEDYSVETMTDFTIRSEDIIRRTIMPREDHNCVLIVTHPDVIFNLFSHYTHRTELELIEEKFTPGSFIKFDNEDYIYWAKEIYYNPIEK